MRLTEHDHTLAAALLAVDPLGLGGAVLQGPPSPARGRWLRLLQELLPDGAPVRRVPSGVTTDRLLGGLDLAATLATGRLVAESGLLAQAHEGVVVLAMAERLSPGVAAQVSAAMDRREVQLERDGLARALPAAFALVALDESELDEPGAPTPLIERSGLLVDLRVPAAASDAPLALGAADAARARAKLASVAVPVHVTEAVCAAALALGVSSLRAPLQTLAAARAAAALRGGDEVADADLELAARLVLAPRATRSPSDQPIEPSPPPAPADAQSDPSHRPEETEAPLEDRLVAVARAALPADLLAGLDLSGVRSRASGRAGGTAREATHGRRIGVRAGRPSRGRRLDVLETVRAAAPWQRVRGRAGVRVEIRGSDFRIRRFVRRSGTTMIFAVDASGSTALHRLAEAKGAVELLLAQSYVRRDRVALISFRGHSAELVLSATRSLTRAKRALAAMPGGGGTPLAAGIDAARALAQAVERPGALDGGPSLMVLLTDGRANVSRDGSGGRERAEAEALEAARAFRRSGTRGIVIDTAVRPGPFSARLAREMGARYLPLPAADSGTLSEAVARTARAGDGFP